LTSILGISAFYHDSAAAIVVDGRIVAAAQEERFTRRKGEAGFPACAARYCLREAGLEADRLDHVAFYEKPLRKFERILETALAFAPRGLVSFLRSMPLWLGQKLNHPRELDRGLGGGWRGRYVFADHHESHAASAFFPSPFDEAAILTLDGVGEWSTATLGAGRGNRLELTHEVRFPHSLGLLYAAFTAYLGFKVNSGEHKVMGLAPYGRPRFRDVILEKLVDLRPDGSFRLDMRHFGYGRGLSMTTPRFHALFGGPPREPESRLDERHADIAASIQSVCEEAVLRAARHAHARTGLRRLVMAGGVALNAVANGRVLREGPFERVWIQPAAGDAGGALGAALLVWHQLLGHPRAPGPEDSMRGAFLGPSYSTAEIRRRLEAAGARFTELEEPLLLDRVARAIEEGRVAGWYQGRMEYGPRALGARSILGDPRRPEMQSRMNLKIKFRESFRPFAPAVLRSRASEALEIGEADAGPYMILVAPVRPERRRPPSSPDPDLGRWIAQARSDLPAVTHVDYSARVQTVDERHGRFFRLLRRFEERTGCPVLINTSFNVRGEPIVESPEDALRCFLATDMDLLAIGDLVLEKADQPEALRASAEAARGLD
jgi:carbamoyltransferase